MQKNHFRIYSDKIKQSNYPISDTKKNIDTSRTTNKRMMSLLNISLSKFPSVTFI